MQRDLGIGVPPVVLLGWSRDSREAGGAERLTGMDSSCVLGSATASLAAPLLCVCVLACEGTCSDRDICEPQGLLRRSAVDERAGMH